MKKYRFWTLFRFPVGSSQTCKDLGIKTLQKNCIFQIIKAIAPRKCAFREESSHALTHEIAQVEPNSTLELFFKMKCSNNFKSEAPRLLHKLIEQTREIACFDVFFYGSFQLGSLLGSALKKPSTEKRPWFPTVLNDTQGFQVFIFGC